MSTAELSKIENEYIRNLQQQIYFLELEANYLYPMKILKYIYHYLYLELLR